MAKVQRESWEGNMSSGVLPSSIRGHKKALDPKTQGFKHLYQKISILQTELSADT